MSDQPPFDIPQPPAEKPQGDFNPPPMKLDEAWGPPRIVVDASFVPPEQRTAPAPIDNHRADKAAMWKAWEMQCGQRKAWIAGKKADYDRVKQERVEALQQFNTYWDTKLNAARSEYDAAKAYPVPPRPV